MNHPYLVECPHCEHFGHPQHARDRVRSHAVWVCDSCRGVLPGIRSPRQRRRVRQRGDE